MCRQEKEQIQVPKTPQGTRDSPLASVQLRESSLMPGSEQRMDPAPGAFVKELADTHNARLKGSLRHGEPNPLDF